jgi:hypothetical protein
MKVYAIDAGKSPEVGGSALKGLTPTGSFLYLQLYPLSPEETFFR